MSDSQVEAATLSVDDVVAMTDEQLTQFLQKHRRSNGDYKLTVTDWSKLSLHDRNQLVERFKAQKRNLSPNHLTFSPALDLDQLDARLRQVRVGDDTTPGAQGRMQGRTTPPDPDEGQLRDRIDDETEAYNDLVSDGGCPLYPISLLEQVCRNAEKYRDMLLPFWKYPRNSGDACGVFERQLKRWRAFRSWQVDNRGLEDDEDSFPANVERMKRLSAKDEFGELAKTEAKLSWLNHGWLENRRERMWQQRWQRESGCNTFSDYVDAARRRLARHGFTQPFELREDPKKQDRLTTWIEYLCFEYWWLDQYTDSIQRLKPHHDRRWQELVDMKITKPHETEESIRTTASTMAYAAEQRQAWEAKQRAEAEAKRMYFLPRDDPHHLTIPKEKRMQMLVDARQKFVAAHERYKSIRRQVEMVKTFIWTTFSYKEAQKDAAGHAALTQWVVKQVPLIQAELIETETSEASSGTRNEKEEHTRDEGKPDQSSSKTWNSGHGDVSRSSRSSQTDPAHLGEGSRTPSPSISGKDRMARDEAPHAQQKQENYVRLTWLTYDSPGLDQRLHRSARIATPLNPSQELFATMFAVVLRPRLRPETQQRTRILQFGSDTEASAASESGSAN
ncbi:hypothetical protein CP533_4594 [Ophiocordyceps camponoti-saundersi (nom. inval.)]|nr:hypothetical protein CP533_4594 [Ophiocordyceps camponoti-saundersi (nom. inval.)]